jgi:preprotein translocase subunit Sec63
MLTKAYECLSDETMKETCKKYGNPDGPTAF